MASPKIKGHKVTKMKTAELQEVYSRGGKYKNNAMKELRKRGASLLKEATEE